MASGSDIFLACLALLFPPLPVWVKCGLCSVPSILNLLLCMLGLVPGLLHSWYIIFTTPDPYAVYDPIAPQNDAESAAQPQRRLGTGHGDVRYVYVYQEGGQAHHAHGGQQQQQQQQGYGSMMPSNGTFGTAGPQPALAPQQTYQPGGEGASSGEAPPPAYEQVIQGDHKVQRP